MPFDINAMMSGSTDAPMATNPEIPPEGDYLARVGTPETPDEVWTKWVVAPRGKATWPKLAIPFEIIDETLLARLNRKKLTIPSDFRLDVDSMSQPEVGPGKNVDLGRLRAAVGQNQPGQPWSLPMLAGTGPVKVTVKHQPNVKDPSNPYVRVTRVQAAT